MPKMTKEQSTVYAAGVFDASGAISTHRPLASALKDTKKHECLIRLQQTFKGELEETPGQGRGEGKTFIQWKMPEPSERIKFFTAILPYSVASENIERHLTAIG